MSPEHIAESVCPCDYAVISLGRIDGIDMGRGRRRVTTHPKCPDHALCQGYTATVRAKEWNGEWLYCNVHARRDCPAHSDGSGR